MTDPAHEQRNEDKLDSTDIPALSVVIDRLEDRLRAVKAERDMWEGIAESQTGLCVRRKAERDAARAEVARLREALEVFVEDPVNESRAATRTWQRPLASCACGACLQVRAALAPPAQEKTPDGR